MNDLVEKLKAARDDAKFRIIANIAKAMKDGALVVANPNLTGSRCEYHVSPEYFQEAIKLLKDGKNGNK